MARIILDINHPAYIELAHEGIGFYAEKSAEAQKALRIGFVNLMPNPTHPVVDFTRLFARHACNDVHVLDFTPTPNLIRKDALAVQRRKIMTHISEIQNANLDAIILTGYGVEKVPFQELEFWNEITDALDYAETNNVPVLASCWGSHAALYHHHGVERTYVPDEKISGIFQLQIKQEDHPLVKGISGTIDAPVSRHGRSDDNAIQKNSDIAVLATSDDAGISIATDGRILYLTGHPEYAHSAVADEYKRDLTDPNINHVQIPKNVFIDDNPAAGLRPNSWKDASGLLIKNWLHSVALVKYKKSLTSEADLTRQGVSPSVQLLLPRQARS
jgi:homoserine O-succinyltransferase